MDSIDDVIQRPSKPTMDDVARRAGVSRALVSLALRGSDKVADHSRRAVMEAADALGYRPNLVARSLASRQTRTIGFIINDLHNPFFSGLADGAREAVGQAGYRLLMNSAFLNADDELAALDLFIDLQVDGVVLTGGLAPTTAIDRAGRQVPLVVVSRPMPSKVVDRVNNDDVVGSALVVEHLVELGHRSIAHISGGGAAGARLRLAGYEATMQTHGLEPIIERGSFTEASGVAAAERLLATRPDVTAIYAGNDLSAVGVLNVMDLAGISVPGEMSVVGYDNTFVAALGHVGLTSVEQHRQEMGSFAIDLLLERIERGRTTAVHRVVPPSLVVRNTSGPVRR